MSEKRVSYSVKICIENALQGADITCDETSEDRYVKWDIEKISGLSLDTFREPDNAIMQIIRGKVPPADLPRVNPKFMVWSDKQNLKGES